MATGIFKLRDQLYGLMQKAWSGAPSTNTYTGNFNQSSTAYLTSTISALGTADYTIEFWCNLGSNNQSNNGIFLFTPTTSLPSSQNPLSLSIYNNSVEVIVSSNLYILSGATSYRINPNTWNHIALVRSSGSTRVYVNGNQDINFGTNGVATDSTNYTQTYLQLGVYYSNVFTFSGSISNFRVTNTVVYSSGFNPPVSPLTAISGTKLLTLQNATFIDNSGNSNTITNAGAVTSSVVYPFNINNTAPAAVEYLVVAGGGAGGGGYGYSGGGGGAGGLLQGISNVTAGTSLTVTVGAGGTQTSGDNGNPGGNSVFGSITAIGGGGGSDGQGNPGFAGGSGGGVGANSGVSATGGQAVFGQGNMGGVGWPSTSGCAGGGGGAGAVGSSYVTYDVAGSGGGGATSSITGTITAYAGGGGGGGNAGNTGGYGGVGGGGNGCRVNYGSVASTAGTTNTGGGGGGGSNAYVSASNGGSGIVIISYPDTYNAPSALTGTYTASTSGSGSLYYPDAGGSGAASAPGYIKYTNTSAFQTGTTATYEFWINPTRFSTNHRAISQSGANSGIDIIYDGTNLSVGYTSGGANASISGVLNATNTWTHVAVVFNSGTMTIYLNGVSQTLTGTTTGYNFTSTNALYVGSYASSGQYGVIGYLSNVRIVKGVAVYTGNFTPIIKPLAATQSAGTNISAITGTQTSLLLNSTSGSYILDSSSNSYVPVDLSTGSAAVTWNQASPFATGLGYKNRVYTWTGSGTVTF